MPCMVLSEYNIVKKFVFFMTEQSDVVFIKFQTFHVAVMCKGCFLVHLFINAPICASTVLECSCCRIHRYVAAPKPIVLYGPHTCISIYGNGFFETKSWGDSSN
jgi:hypothetical protein